MAIDLKRHLKERGRPIYHTIKTLYVYLNRYSQLCEIPIDICTNLLAFSFAPTGWHYFIETLKEYDQDKAIHFKDTTLYRFYQTYRSEDMFGLLCHPDNTAPIKFRPPFGIYPWGSFIAQSKYNGGIAKNVFTSHLCGPTEDSIIEINYNNLIRLYNELRTNGYRPWSYGKGFIGGTMLERTDGEKRFVVLEGNHRMAALSHLGFTKILARYQPSAFKVIRESEVMEWYYVRNGKCSEREALYYFDLFFKSDGNERASVLGVKKLND